MVIYLYTNIKNVFVSVNIFFFKTQKQTKNDAKKTKTKTKKNNEKMCIAYRD
jgi:hypothetical protein